ncbi:hypothetical protein ACFQ3L_10120 [Lacticaseibacillus jixianensis]|uniref:Uncharacterized protein n=1 Tax=Lacticaseibacillus jixianensis TaxID=2486012 RepID=A0ABW4BAF5_9LACO|nr:hypothetical protein [Lacticaseibacillus jixianensis]
MSDPQQSKHLFQQMIDQVIALVLLIVVWLNRAALGPTWTKTLIIVALVISLADYAILGRKARRKK